jgi:hypothetical protein
MARKRAATAAPAMLIAHCFFDIFMLIFHPQRAPNRHDYKDGALGYGP